MRLRCGALILLVGSIWCISLVNSCKVTLVPPRRSYRYFRIESNGVQCFNPSPVDGLTECRGNCESTGRYTPGNSTIIRRCWCCTPVGQPEQVDVEFECKDGTKFKRKMLMPRECDCKSCEIFDNINTEIPIPT